MKKIFLLGLITLFVLNSCDNKSNTEQETTFITDEVKSDTISESEETNQNVETTTAISLWKSAGLYQNSGPSGKGNKWLVSIPFGNKVTVLESQEVKKKTYLRILTKEGKEGWINSYLLQKNAHIAVVTNDVRLYKSADILSMSEDKIATGTIIVVDDEKIETYVAITAKEKKKKGYLKSDKNLSSELVDLEVAQLRARALAKTGMEQITALQEIVDNPEYEKSAFYTQLKDKLIELQNIESVSSQIEEVLDSILIEE